MFTGLVEGTGRIVSSSNNTLIIELNDVDNSTSDIKIGDSVSVNGVCLTVIDIRGKNIGFDVSHESLSVTNIMGLGTGNNVNIEKSISASGRFHGHFVSGHVDAVGTVSKVIDRGDYIDVVVELNHALDTSTGKDIFSKWLVSKGSVAINGVSLTVNEVIDNNSFRLTLIPHTLKMTNLIGIKNGDRVNIEFDILAKYVQNMINGQPQKPTDKGSGVTEDMLREHGYVK
ncbi:MAG: riboflavin synthase [Proteobacteria bacterium]|nr:riboflavin synthase [Pseudomonadota bacterium]